MAEKSLFDELLDIAKDINSTVEDGVQKSNKVIDRLEKGKKVIDYYGTYYSNENASQREREKREAKWWRQREEVLNTNFKILWLFIILITVVACILFEHIGVWINIYNSMLLFAVVSGIEMGIIAVFAFILFGLRK